MANFQGFPGLGSVILLPAFAGVGAGVGAAVTGGSRPIAVALAAAAGGAASVVFIYPSLFPGDKDSGFDPMKMSAINAALAYAGAMYLGGGGEVVSAAGALVGTYADLAKNLGG